VRSSNDVLKYYRDIKDVKSVKVGNRQEIEHLLGPVDYRKFYIDGDKRKNCFTFIVNLGARNKSLDGWYCAPTNVELRDDVIKKMISTLGIKGKHEPEKVSYVSVPNPAMRNWTDRRVCSTAIRRSSPAQWKKNEGNVTNVAEAKFRGFTPEACAEALGK